NHANVEVRREFGGELAQLVPLVVLAGIVAVGEGPFVAGPLNAELPGIALGLGAEAGVFLVAPSGDDLVALSVTATVENGDAGTLPVGGGLKAKAESGVEQFLAVPGVDD